MNDLFRASGDTNPATGTTGAACDEGAWAEFIKPADNGLDASAAQNLFNTFRDPPEAAGEGLSECNKCELAKKNHDKKCDVTRKRVAYALKQAGCPSVIRAYKSKSSSSCKAPTKAAASTGCTTCTLPAPGATAALDAEIAACTATQMDTSVDLGKRPINLISDDSDL